MSSASPLASSASFSMIKEPRKEIARDGSVHYYYPLEPLTDFIIKLNLSSVASPVSVSSSLVESDERHKKKRINENKNDGLEEEKSSSTVIVHYHVHTLRLGSRSKYFERLFQEAKEGNEILDEMDLLEGVGANENDFKDYLSHIYFASPQYSHLTNDNLLRFLHLSQYFMDDTLYDECRSLLISSSFEKSSAFPIGGYFELLAIARQYHVEGLKEHCIKKLKESDCITVTLNKIKSHVSSSSSSSSDASSRSLLSSMCAASSMELSELLVHYVQQLERVNRLPPYPSSSISYPYSPPPTLNSPTIHALFTTLLVSTSPILINLYYRSFIIITINKIAQ